MYTTLGLLVIIILKPFNLFDPSSQIWVLKSTATETMEPSKKHLFHVRAHILNSINTPVWYYNNYVNLTSTI